MRNLLATAAALILGLGIAAPSALATEPLPHTGRVVISTEGNITIPAGEHADTVVVINGAAEILGEVNALVIVDGTANLSAARLETVVAVRSSVEVADGTVILGELKRLDTPVHQSGNVEIVGGITDLGGDLLEVGAVLAPALVLLWLGFGLAMIVAALLLAGIAPIQIRAAERIIQREPILTGLVGPVAAVVVPIGAIILITTIVGAPLGIGVLLGVLPLAAFLGYLAVAIWIGDWILGRVTTSTERERPYAAAVVGVLVLGALGLIPILGIVVAIASLLGFGAVIRLAVQALRGRPRPHVGAANPLPAPTPG